MKLIFFVLIAATAVSTQTPKPCCAPDQYMAGIGGLTGLNNSSSGAMAFSFYEYGAFDFKNRMIGFVFDIDYMNGTSYHMRIIQKYAQNTQWVIFDQYSYCVKQEAPQPEPSNCVPDEAQYTDTFTIGGSAGILSDNFVLTYQTEAAAGMITFGVTHDTCYPLSSINAGQITQGSTKTGFMSTVGTVNMTLEIPDPNKWFTVPSFCQEQNTVASEPPITLDMLKFTGQFF